ncbi:Ms4533A family Cys-rich leader peptide [Nocardia amamiensis]|uniref:Ms4533A family Cys-rich leader peptide n=1 Tax=Nocardia amamiensis TaxID=404578 RepID=UPI003400946D
MKPRSSWDLRFELRHALCYSRPVSSSAVPQVRHELALIAVGDLAVADVYCR